MKLVWLRNDLRRLDNPALFYACAARQGVTALVTLTPSQWQSHSEAPARMALWRDQLRALQADLAELNVALRVVRLKCFDEVPGALQQLATELQADAVYFNYEYPLNERRRDRQVCAELEAAGVRCLGYHGELVIPPGQVVTGQGGMFKVFTPFSRAWRQKYLQQLPEPLGMPASQPVRGTSDTIPDDLDYQALASRPAPYDSQCWPVGEQAVHARLNNFIHTDVADYAKQRDFPAMDATSRLSAYLSIGALSPLQCLQSLKLESGSDAWLESIWLNELIWREFYRHLLVAWPGMSRLEPFRPEVEQRISWQHQPALFDAWCRGETGYPIVDAAMKQLLTTGWMHNRLRMVVASFLTKLLRVDWRLGADFFMAHLIDADFASNLGGWQWAASVGADAAPYFRIFNPQLQSEKFDPDGAFLLHWLPELASVPRRQRHLPGAGQAMGRPAPIIDYKSARQSSLDDYQQFS